MYIAHYENVVLYSTHTVKGCFGLLHTTQNQLNIFSSKEDENTTLPLGPPVIFFHTLICLVLSSPPTFPAAPLLPAREKIKRWCLVQSLTSREWSVHGERKVLQINLIFIVPTFYKLGPKFVSFPANPAVKWSEYGVCGQGLAPGRSNLL